MSRLQDVVGEARLGTTPHQSQSSCNLIETYIPIHIYIPTYMYTHIYIYVLCICTCICICVMCMCTYYICIFTYSYISILLSKFPQPSSTWDLLGASTGPTRGRRLSMLPDRRCTTDSPMNEPRGASPEVAFKLLGHQNSKTILFTTYIYIYILW